MFSITVNGEVESGDKMAFFHLQSYHKINVILGDSSTGKSWSAAVIELASRDVYPYSLESDHTVYVATDYANLVTIASNNSNAIIIVDEDVSREARRNKRLGLNKIIEASNNYFIIISRDPKDIGEANIRSLLKSKIVTDERYNEPRVKIEPYLGYTYHKDYRNNAGG